MNILGISAFYHDSAACILQNGEILAAAQEERFTRKKHDASFPKQAIDFCLKRTGCEASELDLVAFYEKPFLKFERLLESYLASAPRGIASFLQAMPLWIHQKLWIKDRIATELGFKGKILFPEHHESHAASAFFPSPFEEAAFLTMDGVGEWATTSYGVGNGNKLKIFADIRFPHSLGLLYSAFTYYTGFKVNSGEYKVMGLAPYGKPVYKALILKELIDLKEDGSFKLNMRFFDYVAGLRMTNRHFHKLLGGAPRKPGAEVTQRDMDLARSIQEVTEEVMLRMVRQVHKVTRQKNLCLAGGVALNCVGNGRILREGPFENIWIQPASGDAGGALGAALFAWHHYLAKPRSVDGKRDKMRGSYLGPEFSDAAVEAFLAERGISFSRLRENELAEKVADLIAQGKVVGWFQGAMEFGPRALGARSILGDPRSPTMQERMNLKIKFRESFRPFAPTVTVEKAAEYFALEGESPYMLLVAPVREARRCKLREEEKKLQGIELLKAKRSEIPAVTHVDFSARVQTVAHEQHPRFYALLKAFDEKRGCPVMINTSFNVRGEPIVCTPEDAFRCFMRTGMDYLVLGNCLLDKAQQETLREQRRWMKKFELD